MVSSAAASAAVSPLPVWAILASTVLRRSRATAGFLTGSYLCGFSTMPARVAAWVTDSFAALMPKYVSAAVSIPYARLPKKALFR